MKVRRVVIIGVLMLAVVAGVVVALVRYRQNHAHSAETSSVTPCPPTGEAPASSLVQSADELVPPPTGSTGNATDINESTATLHGEVTPNGEETTVYFQFGPTMDYGSQTPGVSVGSVHAGIPSSADLAELSPNTTYHYQEVIETPTHLLYGADETFTTQAGPGASTSTPQPQSVPATEPANGGDSCR